MSLLDYIKGRRKGLSAHSLERESMQDTFLKDAIDGFDSIDDDHLARITAIRRNIIRTDKNNYKKAQTRSLWRVFSVASIIIIAIVSVQLLTNTQNGDLQAQTIVQLPIDIYVPSDFYQENIAIIAQKNTEFTKDVSIVPKNWKESKSSVDKNTKDAVMSKTLNKEIEPIDIYIPAK